MIHEHDQEEVLNESSLADAEVEVGSSSGSGDKKKGRPPRLNMNSLYVEHSNTDELEDSLIQEAIEIISATTPYDLASRGDESP